MSSEFIHKFVTRLQYLTFLKRPMYLLTHDMLCCTRLKCVNADFNSLFEDFNMKLLTCCSNTWLYTVNFVISVSGASSQKLSSCSYWKCMCTSIKHHLLCCHLDIFMFLHWAVTANLTMSYSSSKLFIYTYLCTYTYINMCTYTHTHTHVYN